MNQAEKVAFLAALAADRYDQTTRLVFADWLDENGLDDEAMEQRRCATPEWEKAARWLESFATKCGATCSNYSEVWQAYHEQRQQGVPYDQVVTPEEVHKEITYEDVIQAGYDYADHEDYFVQQGNEQARDMMASQDTREQFWVAWQTVTGQAVEKDKQGTVFSCSC